MGQIVADKCDRCGKIVPKKDHAASSDMVQTTGSFLYMGDIRKGDSSRPYLCLHTSNEQGMYWCPKCLLLAVSEWVDKVMKREPSALLEFKK